MTLPPPPPALLSPANLYLCYVLFSEERVDLLIEEACNPSRTERLANENFVRLENYIKEISAKYVYTHSTTSKQPLTEKARKSMTRNVKASVYATLLGSRNKDKSSKSQTKFVENDQQVFNFAREDVYKNASTKIPARLLSVISSHIKSIGQISCGKIRGTCWLVYKSLVITNHHVYQLFYQEREELQNPNLPITVTFDYLDVGKPEHIVTVEVDEERDPEVENSHLDYKLVQLKKCEGLQVRAPLGSAVRSRSTQEGLVTIVGHPEGKEMHMETCVVVSSHAWREKLQQKHDKIVQTQRDDPVSAGLNMTKHDALSCAEKYKDCLPYDTSLFTGASGSPVFDLNGNIVAIHTQGYTLNVEGGKCSLMEFGVTLQAICEDLRKRDLLEKYFPDCDLKHDEERMNDT